MTAGIPRDLARRIYRRDGYRCALCDCGSGLQLHHFIPRGNGGSNHPHNLITLCSVCHRQAHGYFDPEELAAGFDAGSVEQAMVEYLADYYADMGEAWNPWLRTGATAARLDHEPEDGEWTVPAGWRGN